MALEDTHVKLSVVHKKARDEGFSGGSVIAASGGEGAKRTVEINPHWKIHFEGRVRWLPKSCLERFDEDLNLLGQRRKKPQPKKSVAKKEVLSGPTMEVVGPVEAVAPQPIAPTIDYDLIDPELFEWMTCLLYESIGYRVEPTQYSRDGA